MRVAVLTNIASPYRIPLFNAVAERIEGELYVICAAETEPWRLWQQQAQEYHFRISVLPGLHWVWQQREWFPHLNWGLGRLLRRLQPAVLVIGGYEQPIYWRGLLYARRHRIPVVLWYESWRGSARTRGGPVFAVKRFFVRQTTVGLALGTPAATWLREIHGGDYPIVVGLNTVDMDFFRREVFLARSDAEFQARRAQYPPLLLLYVGSFIPRKNVALLLKALRELGVPDVGLLLVGTGPQEAELRQLCRSYGLEGRVFFEGFRQQWELPYYYALADALVLPSVLEVWGLVVNEALASGLFVVASTAVGAAYDLIQPGWNGQVFEPTDLLGLVRILQWVREHREELRERRSAVSERACREFGIGQAADRFVTALQMALQC